MVAPSQLTSAPVDATIPRLPLGPREVSVRALVSDAVSLTKPRLTSLVLCTTTGGIGLAGGRIFSLHTLLTLVGTTLAVAGAHTLNCWMERDLDGAMDRTRNRPLPAGRFDPRVALVLGVLYSLASLPVLFMGVNPLTGLLGATALASYVLLYTPMKTRSPAALYVGAIPGALPPLMGWTAVTNRLDVAGVVLFAILFVWQLPHFLAIAIHRKDDYARAGIKTLPIVRGDAVASRHVALWVLALVPVTLALVPLGVAHWLYGAAAIGLGAWFIAVSIRGLRGPTDGPWARKVFLTSLVHLTGLFVALMIDAR
ncbi:MAG: heme o synthase [Polyangiales bacterium]